MTAGALGSPVFSFTSLDFLSSQEDFVRFAQTRSPGEAWTDFNPSDPGVALLESLAYATDLLSYGMNSFALETIVATLVREQNFRNIGKSLDYTLKSASGASTVERCFLDAAGTYPFTISRHLQFAADDIIFQPIADVEVTSYPIGGYVDVDVEQGAEQFNETLGTTDGQPGQRFRLREAFLIDGTLFLSVGLESYDLISNFISAGATDKKYTIETTENGITEVVLGDGFNGVIPPAGLTVSATYKTGGGLETNVPATAISSMTGTSDGSLVPAQIISVTNISAATDGGPKQSLSNAKQNLPLSLKANDRCVADIDYAAMAVQLVPGVFKAKSVAGKPVGGATPILLFVIPQGGGYPTDVLRNQTLTALKPKRMAGKRIRMPAPEYVNLFIEQDLYVKPNSVARDVKNRMQSMLRAQYGLESSIVNFGTTFELQHAYDIAEPLKAVGVSRAFYRTFSVKPFFARHVTVPTTGDGTVVGINVNWDTVRRREWLIRVIPPSPPVMVNRFTVLQRRLGVVTSLTDTLLVDEAANFEANELVTGAWSLHPRPQDLSTTYPVIANTQSTISVAGGLLIDTEPDDDYVVEKTEAAIGKILRTTTTVAAASAFTITVASSESFAVNDPVRVFNGSLEYTGTVVAIPDATSLTLSTQVTIASGAYVDYLWRSADGSVEFTVLDGGNPFVVGDELYVDTYARAEDIILRPENFPQLLDENLLITAIGGVK